MYTNLPMLKNKKKKLKGKKSTSSVQPVVALIGVEYLLEISQRNITENRSMLLLTNGPLRVKGSTFYKNFPVLDTLSLFTIGKLNHVPALNGKQNKALLKIRKSITKTNKTNTPQTYKVFSPDENLVPGYGSYVITLQEGFMRNYNTSEVELESGKSIHSITINPTTFLIKIGKSNAKLDSDIYCTMNDPKCTYIIEYRKILKIEEIKLRDEQYTFQELKLQKELEEFIYSKRKLDIEKEKKENEQRKLKKEKKNELQKREITHLSHEILEEIKAIPVIMPERLLEISQENITENRSMLILANGAFSINKARLKKVLHSFDIPEYRPLYWYPGSTNVPNKPKEPFNAPRIPPFIDDEFQEDENDAEEADELEFSIAQLNLYVPKKTKILNSLTIFSLSDFKMLKPKKALLDIQKFLEEKNIIQKVGMLSISNEKIYRITFENAALQEYNGTFAYLRYMFTPRIRCITLYKTGFLIYGDAGGKDQHNVCGYEEYIVDVEQEQQCYILEYSKILKIEEIPSLRAPFIHVPPFTRWFCNTEIFPFGKLQDLAEKTQKTENDNSNLLILTQLTSCKHKEELARLLPKHLRNPWESTLNSVTIIELGEGEFGVLYDGSANRGLSLAMYFLQKIVYNYFQIAIDTHKKYLIIFESAQLCTYNFTIEHTPIPGQSQDFFQHELKSILLTRDDIKAYSQEEKEIFNSNGQLKKATIIIEYKKILEITEIPYYLAYSPKPYFTLT